jgi:putative protease
MPKIAEIMSPAGSFESMQAAINAGCDSVYFGVEQLNMRARSAHNFKVSDLPEIARKAKNAKIKTYIALNTILYQHDLPLMQKIVSTAKESGISALIAADIAGIQYAYSIGMPVHISTQLSVSNYEAVKFYAQFADTIVLAREVDLDLMKQITEKIREDNLKGPSGELIKIEVFVHGALCIAQSGRCQMSLLQNNTSAQRGACLQECRKSYKITDEETGKEMQIRDGFVLSPKDLCTIDFLDKIIASGVSILKIEGRGRSSEYVDTTTRCYREAVEAIAANKFTQEKINNWKKELAKVYNRGFTDGYYLGKKLPDWSESSGNQATEERIFAGLVSHYFDKAQVAEIKLQAKGIKKGDKLSFIGSTTGVVYANIEEIMLDDKLVNEAKNPTTVTLKIPTKVRRNDKVYILQNRPV